MQCRVIKVHGGIGGIASHSDRGNSREYPVKRTADGSQESVWARRRKNTSVGNRNPIIQPAANSANLAIYMGYILFCSVIMLYTVHHSVAEKNFSNK
jgi:hypothetical protein